ncbi:heparinase II/III family protein [Emticicia oligotrophica DSM 17448]|uniref:Heparinase II/III family protein n=1 Tax=Emticicia oligotrophica (strain DSM 17448 / CIP 109782 / MTCC 6937 / GPTSA100-15) TaxID=929562 RepID=A0ABN4ADR2_EMTOG|nr:heparinase II/III family protein [Emticicia oligotrophica]AFK01570.1 heparinase II/III family protein [Emticicia oligotrophica DSM 17448]
MKLRQFLFQISLFGSSLIVCGQTKHIPETVPVASHPRILLLKGEEQGILKSVSVDPNWKILHGNIIKEADEIIGLPTLERIQIGRRLLDKSRECLRRVFFLSYAFRTTKDKKYLLRAERELVKVSQFSDWNPTHFLDVAEMTMGVAIGYDWLYDDLSLSAKNIIKEAILKKGIEPSLDSKYNSWLKASHNWNQVCNAGMTYGALAIYEENPVFSNQIIERAIESIKLPMQDYKPEGAYPEGYSYWGYGTSFNVMFLDAIKKVFNTDFELSNTAGFLKTAGYFQQMIGASGKSFNYSDAGNGTGLSPAMFWFANRTNNPSLLYLEKQYLQGKDKSMAKDRLLPAAMIWGKGISLDKLIEPKELLWVGQGKNPVAMMRTSWSKPEAIYVGLKAGSPSVNHGHMDVGSFVMDANGQRWSMDFGMQEYESLESKGVKLWGMAQNSERWEVFRYNNLAHSTLAINMQHQRVEGFASINSTTSKPNFLSATTDMSAVYNGQVASAKRGIAIIDQQYVLVKDEIVANEKASTVRWSMLTPADVKVIDNQTVELSQNGKKLILKVIQPANKTIQTWSTKPPHDYDAANDGTILVGFEANLSPNTNSTLEVQLIPEGAKTKSKSQVLKDWK